MLPLPTRWTRLPALSRFFVAGARRHRRLVVALAGAAAIALPLPHRLLHAQVVESATVLANTGVLQGLANELLTSAANTGDYLSAGALLKALQAIDAFKAANESVLNKAFRDLDDAQKQAFANLDRVIREADGRVAQRLEEVTRATENLSNLAQSHLGAEGQTYVMRVSHEVLPPNVRDTLVLRLRGVNLDKGDLRLTVNGVDAPRNVQGPLEVVFLVPVSALQSDSLTPQLHTLHLAHTTQRRRLLLFRSTVPVARQLTMMTLPSVIGRYAVEGTATRTVRERKPARVDMGRFEGRNTDVLRHAPPPAGWFWDVERGRNAFRIVSTGRGEAGSCSELLFDRSTKDGMLLRAHLDNIERFDDFKIVYGPGYSHCGAEGPTYRDVEKTEPLAIAGGALRWTQPTVIPLPVGTRTFRVTIDTFDGRQVVLTPSQLSDKLVSATRETDALVIRPTIPSDITR